MVGWECALLDVRKEERNLPKLDGMGREGWEAVAMVSSWGIGWHIVHPIVLLKRPLDAEQGHDVIDRWPVMSRW
jgi:hypothetical protein